MFSTFMNIGWRFINNDTEESLKIISPIYRIWPISLDAVKYLYESTLAYINSLWLLLCHFYSTYVPNLPKLTANSAFHIFNSLTEVLSYLLGAIKTIYQFILVFLIEIKDSFINTLSNGFCNAAHLFWLAFNQTTSYTNFEKKLPESEKSFELSKSDNSISSIDLNEMLVLAEKLQRLERVILDEKLKRDEDDIKIEAVIKEYHSIIQKQKLDADLASRRCCRWQYPPMPSDFSYSTDKARLEQLENLVTVAQQTTSAYIAEIRDEVNNMASSRANDLDSYGALDLEQIKMIVYEAIKVYDADKTGRADYALESAGGRVVSIRCTKTYTNKGYPSWGFPILWSSSSVPEDAIRPGTAPGECWAFYGSVGYLVLELSYKVNVTGFTIEHIDKSLSPYGSIDSAPQHFSMWGLKDADDLYEQYLFGDYVFEDSGQTIQYFPVKNPTDTQFKFVELKIISNHGHPDYTCLYRIRVHGAVS